MPKTIKIQDIKEKANNFFKNSPDKMVQERIAIQHFVSTLLMGVDEYHGFGYLTKDQSVPGNSIGVIHGKTIHDHVFPDESRVSLY